MAKRSRSIEELIVHGYELIDEGEYKKADRTFKKVLKKDEKNAAAYLGRAEAAFGLPKLSLREVAKLYRDAIKYDPDNVDYYLSYGAFCLENGLLRQAVENYEKAASLDEESAPLFYNDLSLGYLLTVWISSIAN